MNDKGIPVLVKKINEHIQELSKNEIASKEVITNEIKEIDKQINNIINAISQGLAYDELVLKMDELKDSKTKLEIRLKEIEYQYQIPEVTGDQLKNLFAIFRGFIKDRNIPECKRFIQNYVEKVIVYKDHVEVDKSLM